MKKQNLPASYVKDLVKKALLEDKAREDITTNLVFKNNFSSVKAVIISKGTGVFCGAAFLKEVYSQLGKVNVKLLVKDGGRIKPNQKTAELFGLHKNILKGERTALNFLGFLSGMAALTYKFVSAAPNIKILDTRKTIPLYRLASKYAVLKGGGVNHRMDLKESVMVKDTHIAAAGSLSACLKKICGLTKKHITVEIENIKDLKTALKYKINRVLIDNTLPAKLKKMIDIIPSDIEVELSGGVNLKTIKKYASIKRINYISVGALTHSASSFDFSMKVL